MKASQQAIELIKRFEGFSSKPYICPGGVVTIGYGTTMGITPDSKPISESKAESLLRRDLVSFEDDINRLVRVPLQQSQFDALCSFIYNIGTTAFSKSTLLRALNKGKYDQVPYELARWNKAGGKVLSGLTRRRAAEAALWSESEELEPVGAVEVQRDVPSIINTENVAAAGSVATTVSSVASDPASPMTWALAVIAVMTAAVFLYLFLKRRGA